MASKVGIKETKDVVVAVAKFGNAGGKALEDGKVSITDAVYIYEPLQAISAAVEGIGNVPAELADLDAAELKDLEATFAREFDLPQDGIEAVVEKAVSVARGFVELVLS